MTTPASHPADRLQTVVGRYEALVASGAISADPAQKRLARRLDRLEKDLATTDLAVKGSSLGWLFSRKAPPPAPIRGLYVHGAVGRGKTMLMDLFFETSHVRKKRRAHFHAFMADVQDRIHRARGDILAGRIRGDDPIAPVAAAIAEETRLLCFDEFAVWDIADAMILGRLFERLFEAGVVMVATSNVAPHDLYAGGLNRALFLPFIALLESRVDVETLHAATDYRLEKTEIETAWTTPLGPETDAAMTETWQRLTGHRPTPREIIPFRGREIVVPHAVGMKARFDFADLCEKPLAAADYLQIARRYRTVMIERIPVLTPEKRNAAKRLINLVDAFYDCRVKIVVSAAAEPETLWTGVEGTETFEFARTVSRLTEMRSSEYAESPHLGAGGGSAPDETEDADEPRDATSRSS